MKFTIVVSKKDIAGMHFKKIFLDNFGFRETDRVYDSNPVYKFDKFELLTINEDQVYADYLNAYPADFFIFASKHESKSQKPTLTAHAIGNFGKPELGGREKFLSPASAYLARNYLRSLRSYQNRLADFYVALEATHHGPFLDKPAIFIELGSSEAHWNNSAAAEAVVETIFNSTSFAASVEACIGIGGPHYCPLFTDMVLHEDFAFGHVAPEYALNEFDEKMLQQMLDQTIENVKTIYVNKKGLGKSKQKNRIKEILTNQKIDVEYV
ncbi:MAG: hypothetical protein JW772_03165 [Candidatus Diapherotrites archaeon]|nr:hypothetical protein [Candidatus Diapherotrites archaeon]